MNKKVLVIGGGASGLMAAGFAAERGLRVMLLERNERPARKLMITGKGRCNVTNMCGREELIVAVPRNGKFLYSAFHAFPPEATMAFFENLGVPLKIERGKRVFPVSDQATDIVDALVRFARKNGVSIVRGRAAGLLTEEGSITGVKTESGQVLPASAVILCTGGKSYPATGSTGDGYRLAEETGHTVMPLAPSLVPLVIHEGWCSDLQGLSLRNVSLSVTDTKKGKEIYSDFGEMLFTHYGVSGPLILSASAHMREMEDGRYRLLIDLKPALSSEKLDLRIRQDFIKYSNRDFINALSDLLPQKMIPVIVKLTGIPSSLKVNQITAEMRTNLGKLMKNLAITVSGFRPMEEAVITSGGVDVKEINPKTMESKRIRGLFFAGEIIDADAYTGGFNLQIAFSTGVLAGKSVLLQNK